MEQAKLLDGYDISVFHELYEFHIAKTMLAKLNPAVKTLGDIICAHRLQEHVGVNLLHKHFNLNDGEYVLRCFEGRVAKMRPVSIHSKLEHVRPYLWQLADGIQGRHFYPLEFVAYESHILPVAVEELLKIADSHAFLREFAACLWEFGLEDVFGIAALCSRYGTELNAGETMLETTDAVNRVLTLEPVDEALLAGIESTETLWVFDTISPGKA